MRTRDGARRRAGSCCADLGPRPGLARQQVVAERRRPESGMEQLAALKRVGPDARQLVAGAAVEHARTEQAACHAPDGVRMPWAKEPDLDDLAREPRARPGLPAHRGAVHPDIGFRSHPPTTATWHGPSARKRMPPAVTSTAPAPSTLPTSRFANACETGSAGPAVGDADGGHAVAAVVLEHGAQPGRHDLEHRRGAPSAARPRRASGAAGPGSTGWPGPALVIRTTSPNASVE